jgi:hypothetical protein
VPYVSCKRAKTRIAVIKVRWLIGPDPKMGGCSPGWLRIDLITWRLADVKCFGEICGYCFSIFMLGLGVGPDMMGLAFDRAGVYPLALGSIQCAADCCLFVSVQDR